MNGNNAQRYQERQDRRPDQNRTIEPMEGLFLQKEAEGQVQDQ
jgi:hypothetical protein